MHRTNLAPAFDRRNFLHRAIQLAAAPLLLSACGGGGSDEADASAELPADAITLAGQVILPAGLSLAGTHVVTLLGDVPVSATGAFQVRSIASNAAPSQVYDAADNLLLFGILRADQTTLSARSTAEALVYRELGLWAHAPRVRIAALTLLRAEDLTAVEAAIVAATTAGGAAWAKSAMVGVAAAVRAKVAALIGTRPTLSSQRKTAQGMNISPTDRVSGIILEGDGIGACTVTNYFRRRSMLRSTAYAAKLDAGLEFPLPENLVRTDISPIDGISSPLQAIADLFFERKTLYTPVSLSLPTPLAPQGSVYTRYKVYGVGPGMSKGTWDDLPESVKVDGVKLIFKSIVLDYVVPILASLMIYIAADDFDDFTKVSETSDALKDLINGLAKVPELVDYLTRGDFAGCCKASWAFIKTTDSWQIFWIAVLAAGIEAKWGRYTIDQPSRHETHYADYIQKTWAKFDKFFDFGELGFTAFDTVIQAFDISSSRLAETWEVTVTKAKVSLSPQALFIEKNGLFSGITAVSVDTGQIEGMVFGYTWKCGSGHLSTGDKYGAFIDSTLASSVAYDAAGVAAGTVDQIDVNVFLSRAGGEDPVGSAKAKVYVTGLTVTPIEKKLKANESVTLTAATVGMRPLAAGETVTYRWKLGGNPGVLTADDTATATFKADATKGGLAVVTVEAFLGDKRIGIATSNITVGDKLVVAGRLFEVHYKDENCHTGMYIAVPKVTGATHYSVFVSGMRGPVFGTEHTWEINVYPNGTVSPDWTPVGNEYTTGIGGGNGGGSECVNEPDQRWAAWYEGSTVSVTVTL